MAPVLSVENRHPSVEVAVGDEGLVRGNVEGHLRGAAEVRRIAAAGVAARLAQLQQELPVARELEDVRIVRAVAADPDVVHRVDGDAVIRRRPVVAGTGSAPRADEVAVGIELEDRRRRRAAFADRREHAGLRLSIVQRRARMDDPNVVARIDRDADRRPDDPVIGKRLRPERIHLEPRRDGPARGRTFRRAAARQHAGQADTRNHDPPCHRFPFWRRARS